ncbi:cytochrome c oxidase assembly protein [Nocardiopsis dassonvillei]|uniref:cytochrome c oxidase assembly protein n=1 Tax=Nocardiopsis dassonvillei TaxID=2014 RepID=UPI00200CDB9B|nr:cytochrome c oxidase assembly protein [Nocardiopsis dassonvillei]MCK9870417.1 cytochrome c oxidase assembly protein [Nocardiopsis dassonvillei]
MDHRGHEPATAVPGLLAPGAWAVLALMCAALAVYAVAALRPSRRGAAWPRSRVLAWAAGCAAVGAALVGPLAERAHHDFAAHMAGHVLLGMLGPLLLVLAAPATLALRTLPLDAARTLSRVLRSAPAAFVTHPVVAGLLSVGGLWALYRTGLYAATHTDPLLHALVHAHVLAAGCLFTFAVLGGPDPAPHRLPPPWRAAALVAAVAAHNVLAKSLYAAPPPGVPAEQAHAGAQLMYYAGAPVEIALIFLVCRPWLLPRPRTEPGRSRLRTPAGEGRPRRGWVVRRRSAGPG